MKRKKLQAVHENYKKEIPSLSDQAIDVIADKFAERGSDYNSLIGALVAVQDNLVLGHQSFMCLAKQVQEIIDTYYTQEAPTKRPQPNEERHIIVDTLCKIMEQY